MRQARRRFPYPPCGSPNGCHAHRHGLTLAALLRSHTGRPRLAARAFREDKTQRPCGSRRRPVRSPPLLCRSGITAASAPARFLASSLRACAHAAVFMSPVWQPPPESDRLPHRRARAAVAVPPGRGLCAWIHAPARTPAVIAGCRHAAPAQHQCSLPRRLSAEGLTRAFAPRRATSGLVRIPPASVANGGEGRSLGEGLTPQNVGGCVSPTRVFVTRGSAARQLCEAWQV